MLSLVLPKGSLEKATLDLFDAADLTVRRTSDRDYHASIDNPRIDRVRFLRPQEIPSYQERGLFDIGITGRDWITETEAEVVSLGELRYSKATSNPVRVVLAVPDTAPWQTVSDPDAARYVLADYHRARVRRHERGRDGGGQARRQHAHPGPQGSRRARHPRDPDLQDHRVVSAAPG